VVVCGGRVVIATIADGYRDRLYDADFVL
jgi:hypothetical protein